MCVRVRVRVCVCVCVSQVMKIAVAPTVIALELIMFRTLPNSKIMTSVGVVCMGIAVATVNDSQVGHDTHTHTHTHARTRLAAAAMQGHA